MRRKCRRDSTVARLLQPGVSFHLAEDCYLNRQPLREWLAVRTTGMASDLLANPCNGGKEEIKFTSETGVHPRDE